MCAHALYDSEEGKLVSINYNENMNSFIALIFAILISRFMSIKLVD